MIKKVKLEKDRTVTIKELVKKINLLIKEVNKLIKRRKKNV